MRSIVRTVVVTTVVAATLMTTIAWAGAAEVADPNDTAGPFDLRWVVVEDVGGDRARLTVRFYPPFRARSITRWVAYGNEVLFEFGPDESAERIGYFSRTPGGRLVFKVGEPGTGGCCVPFPVHILGGRRLSVRFEPSYPSFPGWGARGLTRWEHGEDVHHDETRWFRLR